MPRRQWHGAGRPGLGLLATGLAVLSVLLVVTAGDGADQTTQDVDFAKEPRAAARAPAAAGPRLAGPWMWNDRSPRHTPRDRAAGAPRRVVIPSLQVDVSVVPIEPEGSTLVPPADPQVLGWWAGGAVTGAARGSALVAGHTVHSGGGALDHLEDVAPGAAVRVGTDHGAVDYEVVRVEVHDKGLVARMAQRLFSQRSRGRLVLVTCEDWNGETYESNVVVVAHRGDADVSGARRPG